MSLTEFLTSCADALREMLGTTEKIPAPEYPARIRSIQTGIDTSDADMTAEDLRLNKIGYARGEKVVGAMPELAAQVITPGTENITLDAGQYLAGAQIIAGDVELVPENIKSGITIFDTVGTMEGAPEKVQLDIPNTSSEAVRILSSSGYVKCAAGPVTSGVANLAVGEYFFAIYSSNVRDGAVGGCDVTKTLIIGTDSDTGEDLYVNICVVLESALSDGLYVYFEDR